MNAALGWAVRFGSVLDPEVSDEGDRVAVGVADGG
jgi:hypothetical protein